MEVISNLLCSPYAIGGLILGILAIYLIRDGELLSKPDPDKRKHV